MVVVADLTGLVEHLETAHTVKVAHVYLVRDRHIRLIVAISGQTGRT